MPLFQRSVLKKYISDLDKLQLQNAWQLFSVHFLDPVKQENIRNLKEEEYQEGFVRDLFVNVLGYTLNPQPYFNFVLEKKTVTDATKSDGAIIHNGKVVAVIELKDTGTADLDKVSPQAFGYKHKHKNCAYVITSNFEKLRFYINDATDYEEFNLFTLSRERFAILYLCLQQKKLQDDVPLQIKQNSLAQEENVTRQLYADYSIFKRKLFQNIAAQNIQYDKLLLFKKTQKLLDRFLFIFFAEDRLLLPPNSVRDILKQWEQLKELDNYVPLYSRFIKYFGYLNVGHVGKQYEIFAYNGGLFLPDDILDHIIIDDAILYDGTKTLSNYDFETDVDVNILGHIFEHSLTEIEELQAELEGKEVEKKTTRRKKDGVFYTPRYITKYIVENTVGALCTQKKEELQINEETFAPKKRKAARKTLLDKIESYRDWLLYVTICDPACGSGAFLNAALEYLKAEHRTIDEMKAAIFGDAIVYTDIDNSILENNLFGVDINEEAIEIAKLSLWLHTAKKGRKLSDLNNNIKCGNSLVDDPSVAGDKAFVWKNEFKSVFKEKDKKVFHITTATHDSRTSERMIKYKVREKRDNGTRPHAEPEWLSMDEELLITKIVSEIVIEDQLNVMAYNICGDHMHLLLVCEEENVPQIMQKIKSKTARAVNIHRDVTVVPTRELRREHAPLSKAKRGVTQHSLWTQKFGCKEIMDETQLWNTIEYIKTNRGKHGLPPLVQENTSAVKQEDASSMDHLSEQPRSCQQGSMLPCLYQNYEHAFRKEFKGGFDVVIGNPPYVRADSLGNTLKFRNYLTKDKRFKTLSGKWDLFIPFIELSIQLMNTNGISSLIIPDAFCHANYSQTTLEWLKEEKYLFEIDYFPEIEVFKSVGVTSIILTLHKSGDNIYRQRIFKSESEYEETILEDYPKSFRLDYKQKISFDKNVDFVVLNKICYISKGIVGNSDEKYYQGEFEVGDLLSNVKDAIHTKLYFEGKDVTKWSLNNNRWIEYGTIRSPKKWSRKGFTEFFESGLKLVAMRSPGYIPRILLDDKNAYFNESAIGFKRWIDLTGINNKSLKKAYINKDERNRFETLSINFDYKYVLCILNSKLIAYQLNSNRRSNIHIYPEDYKDLKIRDISLQHQQPFIAKADIMLSKNKELNQLSQQFTQLLQAKFSTININNKLQSWYSLSGNEFLKELSKQKIKLPLAEQQEWLQYFEEQKTKAADIQHIINETDKQIDAMVYALYGLTEEEIKIVEGV